METEKIKVGEVYNLSTLAHPYLAHLGFPEVVVLKKTDQHCCLVKVLSNNQELEVSNLMLRKNTPEERRHQQECLNTPIGEKIQQFKIVSIIGFLIAFVLFLYVALR